MIYKAGNLIFIKPLLRAYKTEVLPKLIAHLEKEVGRYIAYKHDILGERNFKLSQIIEEIAKEKTEFVVNFNFRVRTVIWFEPVLTKTYLKLDTYSDIAKRLWEERDWLTEANRTKIGYDFCFRVVEDTLIYEVKKVILPTPRKRVEFILAQEYFNKNTDILGFNTYKKSSEYKQKFERLTKVIKSIKIS